MGDDGIKDAFRTGRGTVRVRAVHEIEAGKRGGQAIVLTEVPFQTSVDAIAGKLAELVRVGQDRRRPRHPQRVGAGQDAPRDRAAPRHQPADRAEQPVQAHRRADARSRSTWWRSSTACPARSTCRRRCSTGSTTRSSSSPGAASSGCRRRQDRLHIVEGLREGARHDRRDREGDPRVEGSRRGARRADGRSRSSSPRSRRTTSSTCRSAGSRSSAARSSTRRRKELEATIKELKRILAKRDVLMGVIREELVAIRDAHKAPRRTQIVSDDTGTIDVVALVEDEPYVVTVTARGYVRAVPERTAEVAGREPGGARRGRAGDRHVRARGRAVLHRPRARVPRHGARAAEGEAHRGAEPLPVRRRREGRRGARRRALHEEHPNLVFVTASGGGEAHGAGRVRRGVGPPERHRRDEARRPTTGSSRVPRLGRLRAAARHRERPGHPLRRGRGAPGRPQRRGHPRHPAEGRRPGGRRLRGRATRRSS